MTSLAWTLIRTVASPAAVAAFTAAGATSGLLLWTIHRHDSRTNNKIRRVQRQLANVIGEVSAHREECDCRYQMQRIFATDREHARLFGRAREDLNGMG